MKFDILTADNDVSEGVYVKRVTGTVSPQLIELVKEGQKLLNNSNKAFKAISLHYKNETHNLDLEIYEDEEAEEINNDMRLSGNPDINITLGGIAVTERSKHSWEQSFTFFVNV